MAVGFSSFRAKRCWAAAGTRHSETAVSMYNDLYFFDLGDVPLFEPL